MEWGIFGSIIVGFFDGGWVDTSTLLMAILYGIYRYRKAGTHSFFSKETGQYVLEGLPIFPLFLLLLSVLSTAALTALLHSHKVILGVAAFVALCSILDTKA